jgi:nanoRNase/pAp phosphatase (c-di-AMP/oligoRNAs hydrolase)
MNNMKIESIPGWSKCLTSYFPLEFLEKYDGDTLSIASHIFIAQYGKSIHGVKWAMVFYPKNEKELKVSLRSLPDIVNVRKLAEKLEIGGGHDNASGGKYVIDSSIKDVKEFKEWIINSIKKLDYKEFKS